MNENPPKGFQNPCAIIGKAVITIGIIIACPNGLYNSFIIIASIIITNATASACLNVNGPISLGSYSLISSVTGISILI